MGIAKSEEESDDPKLPSELEKQSEAVSPPEEVVPEKAEEPEAMAEPTGTVTGTSSMTDVVDSAPKDSAVNAPGAAAAVQSQAGEKTPLIETMASDKGKDQLVDGGSKLPQFVAASIATIGGFSMGTWLAWTSPVNEEITEGRYGFETSSLEFSFIGAIMTIGAMIGALCCGTICNNIGRRYTMMALVIPALIGAALIAWAVNPAMMMAGRVVVGLSVGAYSMVCPLYTNEISQQSIRGTLGTFFQLQVTIGILFVYVLGLLKNAFLLTLIISVFPVLLTVLIYFMPETPYYLLLIGKDEEAKTTMEKLRGKAYKVEQELTAMKTNINNMNEETVGFFQAFSTSVAKKSLLIGVGIMFLQQFSGINAVIFYSTQIFKSAGSSMDDVVSSIIVAAVSVLATFASAFLIDRFGRKPILLASSSVMAFSSAVLGIYFIIQKTDESMAKTIFYIPLTFVCLFIIMFSIGLGPIPWMLLSEIFAPNIKAPASSISCFSNWVFTFTVTLGFSPVKDALGIYTVFCFFAVVMVLGCFFIYFLIPETKNKNIEQVQLELAGKNVNTDKV